MDPSDSVPYLCTSLSCDLLLHEHYHARARGGLPGPPVQPSGTIFSFEGLGAGKHSSAIDLHAPAPCTAYDSWAVRPGDPLPRRCRAWTQARFFPSCIPDFVCPVHIWHQRSLQPRGTFCPYLPLRLAFALCCLTLGTRYTHSCFFFCNSPELSRLLAPTTSNTFNLALIRPVSTCLLLPRDLFPPCLSASRSLSTRMYPRTPCHSPSSSFPPTRNPSRPLFPASARSACPPVLAPSLSLSLSLSVSLALFPSLPSSYSVSISLLVG